MSSGMLDGTGSKGWRGPERRPRPRGRVEATGRLMPKVWGQPRVGSMQWDRQRTDSRVASLRLAEHNRSLCHAEGDMDMTRGLAAVALA